MPYFAGKINFYAGKLFPVIQVLILCYNSASREANMQELICVCAKCKSRVMLTECSAQATEAQGKWYEYECRNCGSSAYMCKRDYIKWLTVYKRRMNARQ